MHAIKLALAVSLLVLVAGCGQKTESAPIPKAPKTQLMPQLDLPSARVGEPLVPGTAPGSQAAAAAPGKPKSTPRTDVLYFFRKSPDGQMRGDLEALQLAVDSYSRGSGMSPAFPVLNGDLSKLVKSRFLRALPTPPEGKHYVLDEKERVSLK